MGYEPVLERLVAVFGFDSVQEQRVFLSTLKDKGITKSDMSFEYNAGK